MVLMRKIVTGLAVISGTGLVLPVNGQQQHSAVATSIISVNAHYPTASFFSTPSAMITARAIVERFHRKHKPKPAKHTSIDCLSDPNEHDYYKCKALPVDYDLRNDRTHWSAAQLVAEAKANQTLIDTNKAVEAQNIQFVELDASADARHAIWEKQREELLSRYEGLPEIYPSFEGALPANNESIKSHRKLQNRQNPQASGDNAQAWSREMSRSVSEQEDEFHDAVEEITEAEHQQQTYDKQVDQATADLAAANAKYIGAGSGDPGESQILEQDAEESFDATGRLNSARPWSELYGKRLSDLKGKQAVRENQLSTAQEMLATMAAADNARLAADSKATLEWQRQELKKQMEEYNSRGPPPSDANGAGPSTHRPIDANGGSSNKDPNNGPPSGPPNNEPPPNGESTNGQTNDPSPEPPQNGESSNGPSKDPSTKLPQNGEPNNDPSKDPSTKPPQNGQPNNNPSSGPLTPGRTPWTDEDSANQANKAWKQIADSTGYKFVNGFLIQDDRFKSMDRNPLPPGDLPTKANPDIPADKPIQELLSKIAKDRKLTQFTARRFRSSGLKFDDRILKAAEEHGIEITDMAFAKAQIAAMAAMPHLVSTDLLTSSPDFLMWICLAGDPLILWYAGIPYTATELADMAIDAAKNAFDPAELEGATEEVMGEVHLLQTQMTSILSTQQITRWAAQKLKWAGTLQRFKDNPALVLGGAGILGLTLLGWVAGKLVAAGADKKHAQHEIVKSKSHTPVKQVVDYSSPESSTSSSPTSDTASHTASSTAKPQITKTSATETSKTSTSKSSKVVKTTACTSKTSSVPASTAQHSSPTSITGTSSMDSISATSTPGPTGTLDPTALSSLISGIFGAPLQTLSTVAIPSNRSSIQPAPIFANLTILVLPTTLTRTELPSVTPSWSHHTISSNGSFSHTLVATLAATSTGIFNTSSIPALPAATLIWSNHTLSFNSSVSRTQGPSLAATRTPTLTTSRIRSFPVPTGAQKSIANMTAGPWNSSTNATSAGRFQRGVVKLS